MPAASRLESSPSSGPRLIIEAFVMSSTAYSSTYGRVTAPHTTVGLLELARPGTDLDDEYLYSIAMLDI
ncbi:hypothetical protein J1614_002432 [Plenodomus biglobosus]|nr:hypothetical protein J1614_002432 [Plenodomus biglobosus]